MEIILPYQVTSQQQVLRYLFGSGTKTQVSRVAWTR